MSKTITVPAELHIGHVSTNRERSDGTCDYIDIRIIDKSSGTHIADVEVSLVDFSRTLFGHRTVPCEATVYRGAPTGMVAEHKTEIVSVKDGTSLRDDKIAAKFLKPFEVDGWKGRVEDLQNHHNRCGTSTKPAFRVSFDRFVDPDTMEPIK